MHSIERIIVPLILDDSSSCFHLLHSISDLNLSSISDLYYDQLVTRSLSFSEACSTYRSTIFSLIHDPYPVRFSKPTKSLSKDISFHRKVLQYIEHPFSFWVFCNYLRHYGPVSVLKGSHVSLTCTKSENLFPRYRICY